MQISSEGAQRSVTRFHVMAKPVGPSCNLSCQYCFYLDKLQWLPHGKAGRLSDDLLERFIVQMIEAQDGPEVAFAWQGGEPTLAGLDFFRRVVALQRRHGRGRRITNAIQTNGTLLNDEWCTFLSKQDFLVGISIDGPEENHDRYRRSKRNEGTHERVMRGLRLLRRHHVEFNTLTVVHQGNMNSGRTIYEFLRNSGSRYMQFIPLVERSVRGCAASGVSTIAGPDAGACPVTEWSVTPDGYGQFLSEIFDVWIRRDVGKIFVQAFDAALGAWAGAGPGLCVFAEECGNAVALERNGDVYACDHYVYPEYRRGNIADTSLLDIVNSPEQRQFARRKADVPEYCLQCDYRFACNGGCPKHRFSVTPSGEFGLNYLCRGYRRFFQHIAPAMFEMTRLLRIGRAPADIMKMPFHRGVSA